MWNPEQIGVALPLTRDVYLAAPHVAMTLDDNLRGCLESALAQEDAVLNVVAGSAQFLSVLAMVAEAPVLATLPVGVARSHARRFGLAMAPPPIPLQLPPISLLWSARLDHDAASCWLRDRIVARLQDVEPDFALAA